MKITVSGKQMTVRQSLKDLTVKKLEKFDRYFGDDAEAIVSYSCRHGLQYVEVTILYNGTIFRSEEGAETFQNAIDEAVESLERQMRKNKTRLEKRLRSGAFVPQPGDHEEEEESEFHIRTKSFQFLAHNSVIGEKRILRSTGKVQPGQCARLFGLLGPI